MLLAAEALYFADPGIGIKFGRGEELGAGLGDVVFSIKWPWFRACGSACSMGMVSRIPVGRYLGRAPNDVPLRISRIVTCTNRAQYRPREFLVASKNRI